MRHKRLYRAMFIIDVCFVLKVLKGSFFSHIDQKTYNLKMKYKLPC